MRVGMQINENRYQRWFKQLLTTETSSQNLALVEFLDQPALFVGLIAAQNLGRDFTKDSQDSQIAFTPEEQAFVKWAIANMSLVDALSVSKKFNTAKLRSSEGANFLNAELPKYLKNWPWKSAAKAVVNLWTDRVIDYWFDLITEKEKADRIKLVTLYAEDQLSQEARHNLEQNFLRIAEARFPQLHLRQCFIYGVVHSDPLERAEIVVETVYPPLKRSNARIKNLQLLKQWNDNNCTDFSCAAHGTLANSAASSDSDMTMRPIHPFAELVADMAGVSQDTLAKLSLWRTRRGLAR